MPLQITSIAGLQITVHPFPSPFQFDSCTVNMGILHPHHTITNAIPARSRVQSPRSLVVSTILSPSISFLGKLSLDGLRPYLAHPPERTLRYYAEALKF